MDGIDTLTIMRIKGVCIRFGFIEVPHGTRLVFSDSVRIVVRRFHLQFDIIHSLNVDGILIMGVTHHVIIILIFSKVTQMHIIGYVGYQVLFCCRTRVNYHFQFTFYFQVSSQFRCILPHAIFVVIQTINVLVPPITVMIVTFNALLFFARTYIFQGIERKAMQYCACRITSVHFIFSRFKVFWTKMVI